MALHFGLSDLFSIIGWWAKKLEILLTIPDLMIENSSLFSLYAPLSIAAMYRKLRNYVEGIKHALVPVLILFNGCRNFYSRQIF